MQIKTKQLGKRFNADWIFRNFSYTFESGKCYAIVGNNGSGKSTLLQILCGALMHNQGTIIYGAHGENKPLTETIAPSQLAIAAPYLELLEEFTAIEQLVFHEKFKPLALDHSAILDLVGLKQAGNKQIRNFSSGMKQRLKLAMAFASHAPLLFLDEPTTNLDEEGCAIYLALVKQFKKDKTVIISSNVPAEYAFCNEIISIADYKK